MNDYTEQLEKQIEQLQAKLAETEAQLAVYLKQDADRLKLMQHAHKEASKQFSSINNQESMFQHAPAKNFDWRQEYWKRACKNT